LYSSSSLLLLLLVIDDVVAVICVIVTAPTLTVTVYESCIQNFDFDFGDELSSFELSLNGRVKLEAQCTDKQCCQLFGNKAISTMKIS